MYSYYGLTAAGWKIPGKPLLTALQIAQLFAIIHFGLAYIRIPSFRRCTVCVVCWLYAACYVFSLVGLFFHFFVTSYLLPAKRDPAGKGVGDGKKKQ